MIQCIIKLEIYTVEHKSYGDSVQTIFTDKKLRDYNNYEDVKTDVLKLANLTSKACKSNQEFNIQVCFATNENWCIATYYSYVASINRHLKQGYCQQYKDWETVVSNYQKYVGNTQQKSKYNLITVDIDKVYSDIFYAIKCLKLFFSKNKGKEIRLKESVSNDWDGEIIGIREYNNKILFNCYWQGYKTDGNKDIELTNTSLKLIAKEMQSNGLYRNFTVSFSKANIHDAITNLFVQLGII